MKLTAEATASFSSVLTTAALAPTRWHDAVASLPRIEPGSVPGVYASADSRDPAIGIMPTPTLGEEG